MNSPFKFLDAYQKDDFERFFGREKELIKFQEMISFLLVQMAFMEKFLMRIFYF